MNPVPYALGLDLDDTERDLAERVQSLCDTTLTRFEEEADTSDLPHTELNQAIRDAGLFRYFVPEEYGGAGLSVTSVCLIRERLAHRSFAADEFFVAQGIPVQPIVLFGTEEQKHDYLSSLLTGRRQFAFCLTEPGAGSDVRGISTTARSTADGYVLNGVKRYVYSAADADTFVVFAKIDSSGREAPITAFLFDRPTSGCTATPYPLLAAAPEFELTFDDCPIPATSVLGGEGQGARVALGNLDRLRPTVGAAAVGVAQRALDEAAGYVRERQAFGHPLSDLQGIRFGLADAAARLEAARALVYGAARFADRSEDRRAINAASAKAKLFATETAQQVVDTALQYHGGNGLVRGSIMERLYRAVRPMRIYEGASEVMRVVIARSLLGPETG